ncbi:MAG: hypothetical protein ACI8QC_000214 [Planctomycetota bacterium]|jgi:hypothetical protein
METTNSNQASELSGFDLRMRKASRIFLLVIGIAIPLGAFYLWTMAAEFMPIYEYESSDRGWSESEHPSKGRGYEDVVGPGFAAYVAKSEKRDLVLCRTFKPAWYACAPWIDHSSHERWDLPYMDPSDIR